MRDWIFDPLQKVTLIHLKFFDRPYRIGLLYFNSEHELFEKLTGSAETGSKRSFYAGSGSKGLSKPLRYKTVTWLYFSKYQSGSKYQLSYNLKLKRIYLTFNLNDYKIISKSENLISLQKNRFSFSSNFLF